MSWPLTIANLASWLNLATPQTATAVNGCRIDSREIQPGDCFVALSGEHSDGHDYLAMARENGASCALVSREVDDPLPQLLVDDVTAAFAEIAKHWRQASTAKLVAITGSNGKTTVKEMVASMCQQVGATVKTQGNLNNHLGVPLTLTRLTPSHDFAIVEMGANHPGEIASLVDIAQPDVALINLVAPAHLEGFGSVEGVARAKGEIYQGLPAGGCAIVNADMPYADLWQPALADKRVIRFALDGEAEITAQDCQTSPRGSHFMVELEGVCHFIALPLPGRHNIGNALAAIAVGYALALPVEAIIKGLAEIQPVAHRMQVRDGINQATLIDDTYNANPGSYQEALYALQQFPGRHWMVVGDFGELGDDAETIHQEMGKQARDAGVERLFCVGELSRLTTRAFGEGAEHFKDISQLQTKLEHILDADVTVLLKGSRFMNLDRLADSLAKTGES